MRSLGDELAAQIASSSDVLLVAPFIKADTLHRLLGDRAPETLVCVTRWRAHEILAGVSDLETLDIVAQHGASLWLRHDLHAKYYRMDSSVLIGSANLTAAALGWSPAPNLEILVPPDEPDVMLRDFERVLMRDAVLATSAHRESLEAAVASLRASGWEPPPALDMAMLPSSASIDSWLPRCRTPDRLFRAYEGSDRGMTEGNYRAAVRDLESLAIPAGLDESTFRELMPTVLVQRQVFVAADEFIRTRRRSWDQMVDWMSNILDSGGVDGVDAEDRWETLKAWLLYFFPGRYRTQLTVSGETIEVDQTIAEWRV